MIVDGEVNDETEMQDQKLMVEAMSASKVKILEES